MKSELVMNPVQQIIVKGSLFFKKKGIVSVGGGILSFTSCEYKEVTMKNETMNVVIFVMSLI